MGLELLRSVSSLAVAASIMLTSSAVGADDDRDRIADLEAKLAEAMVMIKNLSDEVQQLKSAKQSVQSVDTIDVTTVQSNVAALDERMTDMEDVILDVEERVGSRALASAFDASKLNIGGFLLNTLTLADGENGTAASFNRLVFELLVSAELDENFSAFFAQAFTREANPSFIDPEGRRSPDFNLNTGAPTPIAWFNYRASDTFNIRVGKWVTPHGIINIEHFPAILLDTEQPQFLRPFSGQTIFPNFQTGIQLHGQSFSDGNRFNYDLYIGNFGGNQDNFNVGGRLGFQLSDTGLSIGVNGAFGKRAEGIASDYWLYGADLLLDSGKILWKTEIFRTDEDFGRDRFAFYSQPAYRLSDQWTGFYRYDFLDDGGLAGDREEHVLGLAFNPLPTMRIRGTTTFRTYKSGLNGFTKANATLFQLSSTFSF